MVPNFLMEGAVTLLAPPCDQTHFFFLSPPPPQGQNNNRGGCLNFSLFPPPKVPLPPPNPQIVMTMTPMCIFLTTPPAKANCVWIPCSPNPFFVSSRQLHSSAYHILTHPSTPHFFYVPFSSRCSVNSNHLYFPLPGFLYTLLYVCNVSHYTPISISFPRVDPLSLPPIYYFHLIPP